MIYKTVVAAIRLAVANEGADIPVSAGLTGADRIDPPHSGFPTWLDDLTIECGAKAEALLKIGGLIRPRFWPVLVSV